MDTKNSHYLSQTVNIASVRQFDVKMMNNLNGFDFLLKKYVPVSKYIGNIPGSEKLYYKAVSSAPTPTHIISRCFFKICIISFSYLVKYSYRFWHLFLFAPVDHITS